MSQTKPTSDQIRVIPLVDGAPNITLQTKLRESVSVTDFGAVPGGAPNDVAFGYMEASTNDTFYLPEGVFHLTNQTTLNKTYWGPGKIRFSDGYIQNGAIFTEYPSRNTDGHVVIKSPADLILNPNGNVTFAGKSIQNVGDPCGAGDAVNLRHINSYILPRIQAIETAVNSVDEEGNANIIDYQTGTFTPTIVGGILPGEGTYTKQQGSWVKIGRLVTLRCSVVWSDHSGTGRIIVATNAPKPGSGTTLNSSVFVAGNPYKSDTPTAELFAGMVDTDLTIFRKDGNGLYTTYLYMKQQVDGVAQNISSDTNIIILSSSASIADRYYIDRTITITGGTGAGRIARISGYSGSSRTATLSATDGNGVITIDGTSQYIITNSGGLECVLSYETNT